MSFSTRDRRHTLKVFRAGFFCCALLFTSIILKAQATNFAGNPQHTSIYPVAAQNLNVIKWTANIDFNNVTNAHYGSPLVTSANTVLTPVKIANNGFRVDAFNGNTGGFKYSLATDYILPVFSWIPVYNPCITTGSFGTRMYYAGIGGTVWRVDNPDSNTPGTPVREVFYTSLAGYNANANAYNNTIFINTPITSDSAGNIYFGFRVQGTAPAPLSSSQSGFARIDPNGIGSFVLAGQIVSDGAGTINQVSHNLAPAVSNDGTTLYVVIKGVASSHLVGLNSTTLATKFSVILRDPRNGNRPNVPDNGTASPMVGPDGDVYFGVLANPNNGSRGFLLHFNSDLSLTKIPGAFGWDYTPGVVPASMVPSYTGTSSYLLFCKYNEYPAGDGNGVNRVAILDPNDTQIDPHTSAAGLVEMREVLTVIAPTPDNDTNLNTFPNAVKEWCINAPAVNPATNSVFFTSEDGHSYRWNLATNSLEQAIRMTPGILEPYVPTVIGPDGTVYTLNGGTLFALGEVPGVKVSLFSSAADLRSTVVGDTVTFTASVSGGSAVPGGTVTFTGRTFNGLNEIITTLASNVPLNATGQASITTSSLVAGNGFLGNHFITATYNGDATHAAASTTMVQKVHARGTATSVVSSPNPSNFGQSVTITAQVTPTSGSGGATPTGMVTFQDGTTVIGQVPLSSTGAASITRSNLPPGGRTITATYASDTHSAASIGVAPQVVQNGTSTTVSSSSNPSNFGKPVTFTATVTAANGAPGIPTGTIVFRDGATVLGSAPLTASGQGVFTTSILSIGSHNITGEFLGTNGWFNSTGSVVQVVQDGPVLLTEENSQRAIALDLVTQFRDPFTLTSIYNLSTDQRRRVSFFVWRLGLLQSDTAANVTVQAEDSEGRVYNLVVENIGALSGVPEVTQVVVRLPDSVVGAPRELFVRVTLRGLPTNRGIIRIL